MIQEKWDWRQNELKDFLQSQLKRTKLKLIILVDALDECRLDEIVSVVSFLEDLSLDAVEAGTNLRICLSSRPYPNISMKKDQEFTLDGNAEHDEDIKKYIQAKLKSDDLEIKKKVLRNAQGVFLWVVLVVAMINKAVERGRPEEMQKTLDDIPSDLDKYFERIIFGDPEKNPETLLMFQIVLFSHSRLDPAELVFAVIAQFQEGYLKPRSQSRMTDDLLKARIVDSSKGLIEVYGEEGHGKRGRVQFIHQTVTDFFLRNRRLERLFVTPERDAIAASHDRLRACYLDYILKFPIESQSPNGQSADELKTEYPFLYYSTTTLLSHTETALPGHQLGKESPRWLLSPDPWFQTWKRIVSAIEFTWYLHEDLNVGLVYILLLHNFHNLLAAVLRCSDVDVNTQGGIFNNALQLAVTKRDEHATRMLLERNASVHLNGGYFGTILQIASARGNYSLVCTILEKGADLNALGGLYGTALQAAAARGNIQILKTLLERGAKVGISGGVYGNALQGAAHNGNVEAVNLLLEHGALVNSKGALYGSALHAAMEPRKSEIFGADVNSCGGIYGSWLDLDEMLDQHLPSVRSSPVSPRLKGTALSLENAPVIVWAARNLDYDQVKLLLENGADVNAASGPWKSDIPVMFRMDHEGSFDFELGMTALIWAARNGKRDIIELLLEYGAGIEARSSSGQTALLAGLEAGHEGPVRFLIERGANTSAKDNFRWNALFKAAANGHVDTMRFLLSQEDFHDTQNQNLKGFNEIEYPRIEIVVVNGGFSTVWPFGDRIRTSVNRYSIQCLVVNGGFLYIGPGIRHDRIFIKSFQINGGTCYFDMDYQLHIQKLEVNGGVCSWVLVTA